MAKYRASVDGEHYYPTLGITVNDGDVVELPAGINAAGLIPVNPSKKTDSVEPVTPVDVPTDLAQGE